MSALTDLSLEWCPNPDLAEHEAVGSKAYRDGMRSYTGGVSVITAEHDQSRAGLTATAVCSVTADPPRLVVFVNKTVAASGVILNSGALCVNVLAAAQEELSKVFAGMVDGIRGEARFEQGTWKSLVTGSPVLEGALASFDCRVAKVSDEGTHHAFYCDVLAVEGQREGDALVYLNGGFRAVPQ